mgnify:CR=1 FL=1
MRVEIVLFIGANAKPEIRSYQPLDTWLSHYNEQYSITTHLAYGCNCNFLRLGFSFPPGWTDSLGQPVDELDATCIAYKSCIECVAEEFPGCDRETLQPWDFDSQSIKYCGKLLD